MRWLAVLLSAAYLVAVQSEDTVQNDEVAPIQEKYTPDWASLDTRPLPQWYDRAKVGIFLHWGVFSVPSFGSEWFWSNLNNSVERYVDFMENNYPPGFTYQEFAPMFTAEFFDPDKWASLFVKSGAKYLVLTSKHHEGFTLFPSKRSYSWNSVEVGPHRDLVGDLSKAVRKQGMKFGVYHSLYEWFNPIYIEDREANFTTRKFPTTKLLPDLKQLVNDYEPSIIWSDGDWEAYEPYWDSTGFISWLYNESPVKDEIVVNDRWGIGTYCKHGDFYNCADRYNPGHLQTHKWENAFTLDSKSWGFRRDIDLNEVFTMYRLLNETVSTVSCGGNALINVGPTKEGTITPIFQERLLALGAWLAINGEAIYDTSPWTYQLDSVSSSETWYTCTKAQYDARQPTARPRPDEKILAVYATFLKWPKNNVLVVKDISNMLHSGDYKVVMLGNEDMPINWKIQNGKTLILLPDKAVVKSEVAWSLKFTPK